MSGSWKVIAGLVTVAAVGTAGYVAMRPAAAAAQVTVYRSPT